MDDPIHLIYVHGFQGDHTSFQKFPTDLHNYLLPQIPSLQTHIYPTYKSSRPINLATMNLLRWLGTLPPGRVILAGHSMGGLLVAEAATDRESPNANRIIGVLGFDAPFLGMHPHVVISGIASLFPKRKEEEGGLDSEKDVNDTDRVNIVKSTDAYPHGDDHGQVPSPSASTVSLPSDFGSQQSSPTASKVSFLDGARNFLQRHSEDPIVKFINKHPKEPLRAMKRAVIHQFEFGICMFDPKGLHERYTALETWQGNWVNLWTETISKSPSGSPGIPRPPPPPVPDNEFDRAMAKAFSKRQKEIEKSRIKAEEKAWKEAERLRKEKEQDTQLVVGSTSPHSASNEKLSLQKPPQPWTTPHHFVVLPATSTQKWLKVEIAGADDEVQAHCGMFIQEHNLGYDNFVHKVGAIVLQWVS